MAKVLTISADADGFAKAAEWLEDYSKSLKQKTIDLVGVMLQKGEDYAVNGLGHIDTGETLSTLFAYRNGNKGVILVGGNAIWIEFGTGVVANAGNAPHPKADELGMSPWGTFGQGKGANPNGWWYMGDDGIPHHTYGIPANRFMYNAAQMLRRECPQLAKEVFK